MFESLTKHLPAIENAEGFGNWVVDRESKSTMNSPIKMPYVNYGTTVADVEQAIYDFVDEHPEYELTHYRDILERNGLEWGRIPTMARGRCNGTRRPGGDGASARSRESRTLLRWSTARLLWGREHETLAVEVERD